MAQSDRDKLFEELFKRPTRKNKLLQPSQSMPKREPSYRAQPPKRVFITPDKTVCRFCPCYPYEEPYRKPMLLRKDQKSPASLLELCQTVCDHLPLPGALNWSVKDVVNWMSFEMGFPQYTEPIFDNHIDGRRLIRLEDPSVMPEINIHNHLHITKICAAVRELYDLEIIKFSRSIGLPVRYPNSHFTLFKAPTGPRWGLRDGTTRSTLFHWMGIISPQPPKPLDHWEAVWARADHTNRHTIGYARNRVGRIAEDEHPSAEYQVPRRWNILDVDPKHNLIWKQTRKLDEILLRLHGPTELLGEDGRGDDDRAPIKIRTFRDFNEQRLNMHSNA